MEHPLQSSEPQGGHGTPHDETVGDPSLDDFEAGLRRFGLQAALGYLNKWVPHRFTAIYALEGDLLRNMEVFDERNEIRALDLQTVQLNESFCQVVLRDGKLITTDSAADARLEGSPYQGVVHSYVGVPVAIPGGGLYGTPVSYTHLTLPTNREV